MSIVFGKRAEGPLRQGEILTNVWEIRPDHPSDEPQDDNVAFRSIGHPHLIVVTPECDLEQDFKARFPGDWDFASEKEQRRFTERPQAYLIDWVLLCKGYLPSDIRARVPGSDVFRRVKQNQDERYQRLGPARVWDGATELEVYFDFKSVFSLPTASIYAALYANPYKRLTVVQPLHLQDFLHRLSAFTSRIGLE